MASSVLNSQIAVEVSVSIDEEYVIELFRVKGVNRYLEEGNPEPDTSLRDNENVLLKEDIREYFNREVLPHLCLCRGRDRQMCRTPGLMRAKQ